MSTDFLEAFARLPRPQQKGIRSLISKFEADPRSSGLNYEPVKGARDPNMRSLRVDRGYRAIVLRPRQGNIHMLLWADKHDKAYSWAERRACAVNPETGAIQIYQPAPEAPTVPQWVPPDQSNAPFASLRRRQLVRLGVPEAMVSEVLSASGEADLDEMQGRLPEEAYEALFFHLAGDSYEKIIREREASSESIDTNDFGKALRRTDSRNRFVLVHDEVELEAMLNAPLEKWRVFLHPSQRRIVERHWNGPVRVLGAAGTGKTVVAMHRARWLARKIRNSKKILFVTFNRNLATDIRYNLRQICSPKEMRRIEVKNLDAWVVKFLRERRYGIQIVYGREKEAWEQALALKPADLQLPNGFYESEWEQVVQANGVSSQEEYFKVSRLGRGIPLNRSRRRSVWKVFEAYKLHLTERNTKEVEDAFRDAADLVRADPARLRYSSVVVDEAQDLNAQGFRLLRSIVPKGRNDIFVTGDCHQRIYGRRTILGRCGIDIRGRSRKLRLNYRTTEQTRAWAASLLEGREIDDLDGGTDDNHRIRSLTRGPEPLVRNFGTRDEQVAAMVDYLKRLRRDGATLSNVCLVARTKSERDAIGDGVVAAGLDVAPIDREGDDREAEGTRIATMHRVKGLEFERVVLASVNEGLLPLGWAMKSASDEIERASIETMERALVYVAASRAKKELLVLSYGRPSPFLEEWTQPQLSF